MSFLLSALVFFSDYRDKDELYLRRILQSDRATVTEFVWRKYRDLTTTTATTTALGEEERDKGGAKTDRNNRKYPDKREKKGKHKEQFG